MAPELFTYDITTLQSVITWHCSLTVRPVVGGIAPKREYEHPKEGNDEHHNRQEETRHKPVTGSLTTHRCVRHNGTLSFFMDKNYYSQTLLPPAPSALSPIQIRNKHFKTGIFFQWHQPDAKAQVNSKTTSRAREAEAHTKGAPEERCSSRPLTPKREEEVIAQKRIFQQWSMMYYITYKERMLNLARQFLINVMWSGRGGGGLNIILCERCSNCS